MIIRFYEALSPALREQLAGIYADCLRAAPLTLSSALETGDDAADGIFAAFSEKEPVGYAAIFADPDQKQQTLQVCGFVSPAYRRQGVFHALLQEIRRTCPECCLQLLTDERDADARRLLEKLLEKKKLSLTEREYLLSFPLQTDAVKKTVLPENGAHSAPPVLIRPAQDRKELTALHGKIFFPDLPELAEPFVDSMLSEPDIRAYVIRQMGANPKPIGSFFLLEQKKETSADCFLCGFGILPGYRRKGYALRALACLADMLRNAGTDTLSLQVSMSNTAAFRLYEKFGFTCRQFLSIYSLGKDFH